MNTEYVDEQLRMTWPEICRMACAAMIRGMTINQFVESAMLDYIATKGQS